MDLHHRQNNKTTRHSSLCNSRVPFDVVLHSACALPWLRCRLAVRFVSTRDRKHVTRGNGMKSKWKFPKSCQQIKLLDGVAASRVSKKTNPSLCMIHGKENISRRKLQMVKTSQRDNSRLYATKEPLIGNHTTRSCSHRSDRHR